MLLTLSVRDVVLIRSLDLTFESGLGVLTGETGAGKSILLDSLGLALGQRAEAGLLRTGADQAVISASFDIPADHAAHRLLAEKGLASDGELILRRVLTRDGRSRAFVNDQPVSVGLLKEIGDTLVEVQAQFAERGAMGRRVEQAARDLAELVAPQLRGVVHQARVVHQLLRSEAGLPLGHADPPRFRC